MYVYLYYVHYVLLGYICCNRTGLSYLCPNNLVMAYSPLSLQFSSPVLLLTENWPQSSISLCLSWVIGKMDQSNAFRIFCTVHNVLYTYKFLKILGCSLEFGCSWNTFNVIVEHPTHTSIYQSDHLLTSYEFIIIIFQSQVVCCVTSRY